MDAVIAVLQKAGNHGLNPEVYSLNELTARRGSQKRFDQQTIDDLDPWLTFAYIDYGTHVATGRYDPKQADKDFTAQPPALDLAAHLEQSLASGTIEESLGQLAPPSPEYLTLQKALARYRDIAAKGGWPALPEKTVVKPGARVEAVTAVRQILVAIGDLQGQEQAGAAKDPMVFDPQVVDAVRRFQWRHGLKQDGVISRDVVAAMNVSAEARVQQITVNMERWRWLPRELGDRHIRVNLPAYLLEVYEHGAPALSMRVVVGKQDTPTPILSDELTQVVFSPYWNIPESIAKGETIPAVMKDPSYLARHNIDLVRGSGQVVDASEVDLSEIAGNPGYRFRQRPGAQNALGTVKFIFPNHFNVYLHDTPAESLFNRIERDFSHGCVRVEQPTELAHYVLRDQPSWTPERIAQAMNSGQEQVVALKAPIPVHLTYFTAWGDRDGTVHFREDIYGYDGMQIDALHRAGAADDVGDATRSAGPKGTTGKK